MLIVLIKKQLSKMEKGKDAIDQMQSCHITSPKIGATRMRGAILSGLDR